MLALFKVTIEVEPMTDDTLVKKILSWDRHAQSSDKDLSGINLRGADLRGANLLVANLRRADLSDADLSGANLGAANLGRADLSGADLERADLSGADFNFANLSNANLSSAYLSGANLNDAFLGNAVLLGADLDSADLSGADLRGANLSGANLSGANPNSANLIDANLSGVDLSAADLSGAKLGGINLSGANLSGADLSDANLCRADLSGANLSDANLRRADLCRADLSGAYLSDANLRRADLSGANLSGADLENVVIVGTIFGDTNLANAENLETCDYYGPSIVDHRTFERSNGLPDIFLRGCGLPDSLIEYFPSLLNQPISFYSCFISYSHADKAFARRLHDALQGRGIRCWLDEHQLRPGDDIYKEVDRGLKLWDKVLLCASEASLSSWWVDNEITIAFSKERNRSKKRGGQVLSLIPLNLDNFLFDGEWGDGKAEQVRKRLAADFTGWEADNDKFESAFEKVVLALREDGRETPPEPKL